MINLTKGSVVDSNENIYEVEIKAITKGYIGDIYIFLKKNVNALKLDLCDDKKFISGINYLLKAIGNTGKVIRAEYGMQGINSVVVEPDDKTLKFIKNKGFNLLKLN